MFISRAGAFHEAEWRDEMMGRCVGIFEKVIRGWPCVGLCIIGVWLGIGVFPHSPSMIMCFHALRDTFFHLSVCCAFVVFSCPRSSCRFPYALYFLSRMAAFALASSWSES